MSYGDYSGSIRVEEDPGAHLSSNSDTDWNMGRTIDLQYVNVDFDKLYNTVLVFIVLVFTFLWLSLIN